MKLLFSFVNLIESINIPVISAPRENNITAIFGDRRDGTGSSEQGTISLEQIKLMEHALGNTTCYRNHFLAAEDSREIQLLQDLETKSLVSGRKPPLNAQGTLFHVTEEGKKQCFLHAGKRAS